MYYTTRAIELVREAEATVPTVEGAKTFANKLEQAISLLALAKAYVKKVC